MFTLTLNLAIALAPMVTDVNESLAEALTTYEKIRSALADDRFEGIPDLSERLAKAAAGAAEQADGAFKSPLKAMAQAAAALKEAKDLGHARRGFGDVSRALVGTLQADPALARERFIYKCPMVKEGYGTWVQTAKEISNPYMGKKMLRCGEPG